MIVNVKDPFLVNIRSPQLLDERVQAVHVAVWKKLPWEPLSQLFKRCEQVVIDSQNCFRFSGASVPQKEVVWLIMKCARQSAWKSGSQEFQFAIGDALVCEISMRGLLVVTMSDPQI